MDLLAHLPFTSFAGPTPTDGNDCWGYTSGSGREYAIMGLNDRVAFVEITNPTSPVIVKEVAHTNSIWGDIKTYQGYAYVTNETGGGVQIININNIDSGAAGIVVVGNLTTNGESSTHNCFVDEAGGYLYLAGSNLGGGAVRVYALTAAGAPGASPANPIFVGSIPGSYTHDVQAVTFTSGPNAGKQYAFLFQGGNGFWVADVTNKASMTVVAQRSYAGLQYCHQGWLSADQNYVYLDDELDGPGQGVTSTLTRVFDVSTITDPTFAGAFASSGSSSIDHNLYVKGNLIYEANYRSGLRVFDNSASMTSPTEIAWIDTYPEDDSASFDGAWSNYPYFDSGSIAISDINRGLFIVRLSTDFLTFEYPEGRPASLAPNTAYVLRVDVNTTDSPVDPATVQLCAAIDNDPFSCTTMVQEDANTFAAVLPSAPCGSTIRYYVTAENTANAAFADPGSAPGTTYSALASLGSNTLLSYDMETVAGWSRSLLPADATATLGLWERADPEPTAAQLGDDHTANPGVNCWVTGSLFNGSLGANDVDGGKTTLLSPVLNLSNSPANTRIGYWRSYSNATGGDPNNDTFRVDIQNGGGVWVNAETVGPAGAGTAPGWIYHSFRVADFVALDTNVRVRFIAEDAGAGSLIEAAVDDVSVFVDLCGSACDGIDFNNDQIFPDIQDLLDYLSVFGGGPCSNGLCGDIDTNNDQVFPDQTDLLLFLDIFAGGECPG